MRWANILSEQGLDVVVLSPSDVKPASLLLHNVELITLGINGQHFYYRPPIEMVLSYWYRLRSTLKKISYDVIHIHYIPNSYTNMFFWQGINKLVISVWGSDIVADPDDTGTRRACYKRALLKKAKVLTATTHFLAEQTARYLPKHWPIEVIPFGIDLHMFTPKSSKSDRADRIRIGFCKALEAKYAPLLQIKSFAKIARSCPKAELIICGEGSLMNDALNLVEQLDLRDRVIFLGRVPYQNMPTLMQSFDIMIMASASETFGVAAVEAQASGVPVVASDLPGIREAVNPGKTALLIPPGDEDALANALLELIQDREKRAAMGAAGVNYAQRHFDITQGAQRFIEIYERVISGL